MDIRKYTAWFHDGSLKDSCYVNQNHLVITMISAQIEEDEDEFDKKIKLSDNQMIVGKLHLEGLKNITINDNSFCAAFEKKASLGEILDFEIKDDSTVLLGISWINFPLRVEEINYETIVFTAKKIWWENLPALPISNSL